MKYKKTLITLLIFILFYFYLFIQIDKIQDLMTFPGMKLNVQDFVGHKKAEINFEEINIKAKNGNNINGLYLTGTNLKTVYYFHGNGGPLNYFYNEIKYINNLGYNVMAYDYPGYGKSTGFSNIKTVSEFSQEFFDYMKINKNIKNENLIVWGYSVGTAVASDFASKNEFGKLILFSPFSSRYDMGRKYFFGYPVQKLFFLQNSYITSDLVKKFKNPVLIVHGNKDLIVPFDEGKKVFYNYLGSDKHFIEINNAGHTFLIDIYGNDLKEIISGFIDGKKLNFDYLFFSLSEKSFFKGNKKIPNENIFVKQESINKTSTGVLSNNSQVKNILISKKEDINLLNPKKEENNNLFSNIDFKTDNSYTKYISPKISYEKIDYKPDDLSLISSEYIFDAKGNQLLREKPLKALENLAKDFYLNFKVKLKIVSAFRSYEYQKGIKSRGCPDNFCAKAGYSEHQSGLAVDIFETTSKEEFLSKTELKKYFLWMEKNAYKYGFNNSYQNGKEIDGYAIEPWHWRYLGTDLAKYLWENNLTYGQFYNNNLKK